jgi:hypothetical protein
LFLKFALAVLGLVVLEVYGPFLKRAIPCGVRSFAACVNLCAKRMPSRKRVMIALGTVFVVECITIKRGLGHHVVARGHGRSSVFQNEEGCEKFFVRCDMTEEFPFLVTKMTPYYVSINLTNEEI